MHEFRDGESDRNMQVKFRAPEDLVEQFDEEIGTNRSDALRQFMRDVVGAVDQELDVPMDSAELAEAYKALVRLTERRGSSMVRLHRALSELSQRTGINKEHVRADLLVPLERRGYVKLQDSGPGRRTDGAVHVRERRRS